MNKDYRLKVYAIDGHTEVKGNWTDREYTLRGVRVAAHRAVFKNPGRVFAEIETADGNLVERVVA